MTDSRKSSRGKAKPRLAPGHSAAPSAPVRDSAAAGARLRARVAVEIAGKSALTDAGADLLEHIAATGSLSQAARMLGFSYRWAWLLVNGINRAWDAPLVSTATGGKHGGGAQLTDHGKAVLSAYRHLQLELEHFLDLQMPDFKQGIKPR